MTSTVGYTYTISRKWLRRDGFFSLWQNVDNDSAQSAAAACDILSILDR